MTTSLNLLTATRPNAQSKCVISIASGKGGVGKTWFAITLSHALARTGDNVLLFDGDLGLANIDIQLGLLPKHDLGDVTLGNLALKDAVTRIEDEHCPRGGFDILAGKSGSGALSALTGARIATVYSELVGFARDYDRVILDLGAGLEENVLGFIGSGPLIVVATNEPTSLTDAYALIKLSVMRHPGADIRVVINNVSNRKAGQATYDALRQACEGFLKFTPTLLGIVPADPNVPSAIRAQTAFLDRYPFSTATREVEAIAQRLKENE